jgi:hypothetical protein
MNKVHQLYRYRDFYKRAYVHCERTLEFNGYARLIDTIYIDGEELVGRLDAIIG